jgi:hypothetical protein
MTRADIEHLGEVCESVSAQIKASESKSMTMDDFDAFVGRMLWAIHASRDNPRFDENKFRQMARGELDGDMKAIFK